MDPEKRSDPMSDWERKLYHQWEVRISGYLAKNPGKKFRFVSRHAEMNAQSSQKMFGKGEKNTGHHGSWRPNQKY
jgi:hypothetical protein